MTRLLESLPVTESMDLKILEVILNPDEDSYDSMEHSYNGTPRRYLPMAQDLLLYMGQLREAFVRLRYCSLLATELSKMEGLEVHFPVFETDAAQQIRQRPDYDEFLREFYDDPRPNEPPVEHEMVSYEIDEVRVKEWGGPVYRLKRLLDLEEFNGWVQLDIELDVPEFDFADLTRNPRYDDLDFQVEFSPDGTEMTVYYTFVDKHDFFVNLVKLNWMLSSALSAPDTFNEVIEDTAKWKAFNQFKE